MNLRQDVPRWLANDRGFIWASEQKDSAWQLEWRDPKGNLRRVLAPPTQWVPLPPARGQSYGQCGLHRPAGSDALEHLSRIAGWQRVCGIDARTGLPRGAFDDHQTIYVDSLSSLRAMPSSKVYQRDGTLLGELPSVAEEPPFVPSVEITKVGEGIGFYAALVRPRDFDPRNAIR